MNNIYDLIVVGGGTSGSAAAISAARAGAKTLLLEKNSFLGGAMTSAMVTPMMNNLSFHEKIFGESVLSEVLNRLYSTKDAVVYKDGNPAWFNPEAMKCVLDNLVLDSGAEVLFDAVVVDVVKSGDAISGVKVFHKGKTFLLEAKYFIDATADANIAYMAGVGFESGYQGKNQYVSLRFSLGGIDVEKFASWLEENIVQNDVSNVYRCDDGEIYLSVGFSYNNKLYPKINLIIEKAISSGDITADDLNYFQCFSVPNQGGTLAFNCPRISLDIDTLSVFDTTKALILGRKKIRKLAGFLKKYFPGFEESYISNIANELGVRDSRRINAKYILTKDDIISGKSFENNMVDSDYPIDVHQKDEEIKYVKMPYSVPLESCLVNEFKNLAVVGRCVGADFYAQAALRIQPNCFAMGEYVGGYVSSLVLRNDNF